MASFALKAYRETESGAPLALAFLMARDQLSDPVSICLELLLQESFAAPEWVGSKASAVDALRYLSSAKGMSEDLMRGAFGARSVCFAQAKRVELYHFETPSAIVCAKFQSRIFEWGWAPKKTGQPAGKQEKPDRELAAELCDGLCQLGAGMALFYIDDLAERYEQERERLAPGERESLQKEVLDKWEVTNRMFNARTLAHLREPLRAKREALALDSELASGAPKSSPRM